MLDTQMRQHVRRSGILSRILWYAKACIRLRSVQALGATKLKPQRFREQSRTASIAEQIYQDPTFRLNPGEACMELLVTIAVKTLEYLRRVAGALYTAQHWLR